MGFGGINTHVVLEGTATERRRALGPGERALLASTQDAELFLLSAANVANLQQQVEHLLTYASRLSRSELTDLAAELASQLPPSNPPLTKYLSQNWLSGECRGGEAPSARGLGVSPRFILIPLSFGKGEGDRAGPFSYRGFTFRTLPFTPILTFPRRGGRNFSRPL